jgi:iron complex outermembrane receptor protein
MSGMNIQKYKSRRVNILMMSASSAAITALFVICGPAAAADASPTASAAAPDALLDELIVTAQKREESVLTVPLAITSLGETFLKEHRVQDVVDLQNYVPGLNVGRAGNLAKITIRGVSNEFVNIGGDAGVAFHLDGIFIGRAEAQLAGIYDVNRVEVLRGPQGTLYGRNATGGSINVVYNRPTETPQGYVSASYGSYNEYNLEAVASGPLGDKVAGRLSLKRQYSDGYTDNVLPGKAALDDKDNFAARGQLMIRPTGDTSLLLVADYYRDWARGGASKFIGGPDGAKTPPELPPFNGQTLVPSTGRDIVANLDQKSYGEFWGVKSEFARSFSAFDLKSISSYRGQKYGFMRAELDGTTLDWSDSNVTNDIWQASQEFQLVSSGDTALQWIVGAYYYTENGDQARYIPIFKPGPLALLAGGKVNTNAYAAYGHIDYKLKSNLTLALGARYSKDERKVDEFQKITGTPISGVHQGQADWGAFTWDATLRYEPNRNAMAYLRVAKGFKSGGWNTGALQVTPFNPEYILSWEAGYKASFLDRRLRLSTVAFLNNYDDLQVTQVQGFSILLTNAASARIRGAEVELSGNLTDHFKVNVALGYLDAKFEDYSNFDQSRPAKGVQNLSGNTLPNSPEWKFNVGGEYRRELGSGANLGLSVNYYFQDKIYFDAFNERQMSQGPVGRVDAEINYLSPDKTWRLAVFGRNLTDELVRTAGRVGSNVVGSPNFVVFDPPRTYGVSLRREF